MFPKQAFVVGFGLAEQPVTVPAVMPTNEQTNPGAQVRANIETPPSKNDGVKPKAFLPSCALVGQRRGIVA